MRGKLETLDQIAEALTHDGLTPDDLRRILTALVAIVARMQGNVAVLDEWRLADEWVPKHEDDLACNPDEYQRRQAAGRAMLERWGA